MAHSINFAIVGPSNRNKLSQPFRDLIPTSSDQFRKNLKTLTRVRSTSDLSGTIMFDYNDLAPRVRLFT